MEKTGKCFRRCPQVSAGYRRCLMTWRAATARETCGRCEQYWRQATEGCGRWGAVEFKVPTEWRPSEQRGASMVQKWFGGFNGPDRSRLVKIGGLESGPIWSPEPGNLDQSGPAPPRRSNGAKMAGILWFQRRFAVRDAGKNGGSVRLRRSEAGGTPLVVSIRQSVRTSVKPSDFEFLSVRLSVRN